MAQAARDLNEESVTIVMANHLVDELEPIKVRRHNSDVGPRCGRAFNHRPKELKEGASVQ
jgi:hypothetical protein